MIVLVEDADLSKYLVAIYQEILGKGQELHQSMLLDKMPNRLLA